MLETPKDPIVALVEKFFTQKANLFGVEMAFLYGSRAGGFPRPDSDVDIALVFGDEGISDENIYKVMANIALALGKEIKAEINVIPIYGDFRKPMLYYNAIVKGIPVYFEDYNKYLCLRDEAIYQMEDFEIFGEEWQRMVAKSNLTALDHA